MANRTTIPSRRTGDGRVRRRRRDRTRWLRSRLPLRPSSPGADRRRQSHDLRSRAVESRTIPSRTARDGPTIRPPEHCQRLPMREHGIRLAIHSNAIPSPRVSRESDSSTGPAYLERRATPRGAHLRRCPPPTAPASFIATSSPRTYCSPTTANRSSRTSVSPTSLVVSRPPNTPSPARSPTPPRRYCKVLARLPPRTSMHSHRQCSAP